jgi:hypothetical protein
MGVVWRLLNETKKQIIDKDYPSHKYSSQKCRETKHHFNDISKCFERHGWAMDDSIYLYSQGDCYVWENEKSKFRYLKILVMKDSGLTPEYHPRPKGTEEILKYIKE